MKLSYEPARTILMGSAGFVLVGTLPRLLGIVVTKHEHTNWIPYLDVVAGIVFGVSLGWTLFVMVNNARNATQEKP